MITVYIAMHRKRCLGVFRNYKDALNEMPMLSKGKKWINITDTEWRVLTDDEAYGTDVSCEYFMIHEEKVDEYPEITQVD